MKKLLVISLSICFLSVFGQGGKKDKGKAKETSLKNKIDLLEEKLKSIEQKNKQLEEKNDLLRREMIVKSKEDSSKVAILIVDKTLLKDSVDLLTNKLVAAESRKKFYLKQLEDTLTYYNSDKKSNDQKLEQLNVKLTGLEQEVTSLTKNNELLKSDLKESESKSLLLKKEESNFVGLSIKIMSKGFLQKGSGIEALRKEVVRSESLSEQEKKEYLAQLDELSSVCKVFVESRKVLSASKYDGASSKKIQSRLQHCKQLNIVKKNKLLKNQIDHELELFNNFCKNVRIVESYLKRANSGGTVQYVKTIANKALKEVSVIYSGLRKPLEKCLYSPHSVDLEVEIRLLNNNFSGLNCK